VKTLLLVLVTTGATSCGPCPPSRCPVEINFVQACLQLCKGQVEEANLESKYCDCRGNE